MTPYEALAAAREEFGPNAIVHQERTWGIEEETVNIVCFIGTTGHDPFSWAVLGQGPTWEEALAAARRKPWQRGG